MSTDGLCIARLEKTRAQRRARYLANRDKERQQQAAYRAAHLEDIRTQQREYRHRNRDKLNRRSREVRAANIEQYRARDRARLSNPQARAAAVAKTKRWVEANRERSRQWHRNRRRIRLACDPAYKARIAMRRRFYMAIRNQVYDGWTIRSGQAVRLLGCTMSEFVTYIESLWGDGMTWDNWTRDGWHIDHIMPLSSFDLSDAAQLQAACHYTNLRPLWAADNLRKGAKTDASLVRKGFA